MAEDLQDVTATDPCLIGAGQKKKGTQVETNNAPSPSASSSQSGVCANLINSFLRLHRLSFFSFSSSSSFSFAPLFARFVLSFPVASLVLPSYLPSTMANSNS